MTRSTLPPLREELALIPGPVLAGGQPSWTLHDPVRNQYFQIDWLSFQILSRWHLADAQQIVEHICEETPLSVGLSEVDALLQFLQRQQLLQAAAGSAAQLAAQVRRQRGHWGQWLLHHYLFFRIPLLRPDRALSRIAPHLEFLFGRVFLWMTLLAGGVGLAQVLRAWETFAATLVDLVSWQGVLAYAVTVTLVKVIHELGHALAAKRQGCRVPTMGVAFLVLWPVAYTDTNEVWKLADRRQRLGVAGAGLAAELMLAAWATLAWAWLPEGMPKVLAFLLASTIWISSLLLNASPFMRFDGYFLLADALGVPNLHERAFALARWHLREFLFDLGEPPPEYFSLRQRQGLILFAWLTWLYRLLVFLGIAVLVYHFFIKAVGILLFLVEIVWFVVGPLWRELRVWRQCWPQIHQRRRTWKTLLLSGLVCALLLLPWPTRIAGSGLLRPVEQWLVFAPEQAQLLALPYRDGQQVPAGTVLMEMQSRQLNARSDKHQASLARLGWQAQVAGLDAEARKDWHVLNEQWQTARAEEASLFAEAVRYRPVAPFVAVLRDQPPDLRPEEWLTHRELLGRLLPDGPLQVVTYVDESDVHRLRIGDRGLFMAEGLAGPSLPLQVAAIDQDATRTLAEGELATLFGGHVLVRERQGQLYPERAVYRVVLSVEGASPRSQHSWRGSVTIAGQWASPGERFLRAAMTTLWRELGF